MIGILYIYCIYAVAVPFLHRASDRGGGFMSGFVVGGVVFGVLGFVFAPQISKALLGDDDRLRLPRFLDSDEKQVRNL